MSFNGPGGGTTTAWGINTAAQVVGSYDDSSGVHGFLRSVDGSFTTIDDPNGVGNTLAYRINDAGVIVGYYRDSSGDHGFIATPAVPEPSTLVLAFTASLALAAYAGRRRAIAA